MSVLLSLDLGCFLPDRVVFVLFCFSLYIECFHSFCPVSSFFSLQRTWVVDFDTECGDFPLKLFLSHLKLSCLSIRAIIRGLGVVPVSSSIVSGDVWEVEWMQLLLADLEPLLF